MADNVPIRGVAYSFRLSLPSVATAGAFQSAPTLATGDVKVVSDGVNGGVITNITTLPTASGKIVTVSLSAAEMASDRVTVQFSDAAGSEWKDVIVEMSPQRQDGMKLAASGNQDLLLPLSAGTGTAQLNVSSGKAPATIAAGDIAADAISASAFAQAAADKVWSTTTRILSAGTNIVLAKGTGVTGFTDTTAAQVWDYLAASASTSGSIGKRIADNLDAQMTSRMATFVYTAPDNTLTLTTLGTALDARNVDAIHLGRIDENVSAAKSLTSGERSTLAAAIEAALVNDGDATALLQAIADKIGNENVDVAALAVSIRDAILDRVLSGNHDQNGTVGKLIQFLDITISSRASETNATDNKDEVLDAIDAIPAGGDATEAKQDLILAAVGEAGPGEGIYPIDHNGGSGTAGADIELFIPYTAGSSVGSSSDVMRFTAIGVGIPNLHIDAYLASAYDAGSRNIIAQAFTGSDGRWLNPILLNPGTYYLIVDSASDGYQATQIKLVVP